MSDPVNKTDFNYFSMNASLCESHKCIHYYSVNNADYPSVEDYISWRDRCRHAGCLYRAAIENNVADYVVEDGYWYSEDKLFNEDTDHWEPGEVENAITVSAHVEMVKLVCNNSDFNYVFESGYWHVQDPHAMDEMVAIRTNCSEADDSACCPKNAVVYWRPCDNSTEAGTSMAKDFTAERRSKSDEYRLTFTMARPDTYRLTTVADFQGHSASMLPIEFIVGPGQLSVGIGKQSILLQPQLTSWAERMALDPKLLASDVDIPQQMNPHAGPGATTWFQNQYTLTTFDKNKEGGANQRYGTDQLFVRIRRVTEQTRLGASAGMQPNYRQYPYVKCFATPVLEDRIRGMGRYTGSLAYDHGDASLGQGRITPGDCAGNWKRGIITPLPACTMGNAGKYNLSWTFNESETKKSHGVFELDMFLCPLSKVLTEGTDEADENGWKSCFNPKAQQTDHTAGQPDVTMYEPNQVAFSKKGPLPLVFTVCPANSVTTAGKWASSGYVQGPQLHLCTCQTGYMGQKGKACQSCGKGKYTSTLGAPTCTDCALGKHCSCTTSGNCPPDGSSKDPACRYLLLVLYCDLSSYLIDLAIGGKVICCLNLQAVHGVPRGAVPKHTGPSRLLAVSIRRFRLWSHWPDIPSCIPWLLHQP
jgi:hypothetical protein